MNKIIIQDGDDWVRIIHEGRGILNGKEFRRVLYDGHQPSNRVWSRILIELGHDAQLVFGEFDPCTEGQPFRARTP